jgi:hypothetical protein
MFRLFCGISLMIALSQVVLRAEGGPPLITADPGTPDRGHFEINFAFTHDQKKHERSVEAPLIDINYGLLDHLQLKFEAPLEHTTTSNPSQNHTGLGTSLVGLKGRFLDEEKNKVSISFYPQLEFGGFSLTPERRKETDPTTLLLPFQIEKHSRCSPSDLNMALRCMIQRSLWHSTASHLDMNSMSDSSFSPKFAVPPNQSSASWSCSPMADSGSRSIS